MFQRKQGTIRFETGKKSMNWASDVDQNHSKYRNRERRFKNILDLIRCTLVALTQYRILY